MRDHGGDEVVDSTHWEQSPDGRISVIGALGLALADVLDWLAANTTVALRNRVVVIGSEMLPNDWPEELRFIRLASDELADAPSQSCLCCAVRSELASVLSQLFMRVLRRQEPLIGLVIVVSRADRADVLQSTLRHAPFLSQRYRFAFSLPTVLR